MHRRTFLQLSAHASAGLLAGCATTPADPDARIGLQLFSLRDGMHADPKAMLKQVARFGYTQIESYEGDLGMYWGMSNTDFKSLLDDLGLELVASHINMNADLRRKVDEAAQIGVSHLICPWIGPQATIDTYKQFADGFNHAGEICAKAGIRFAFHNHEYSFTSIDGVSGQSVLLDYTDPKLVDFELDIYWAAVARQDPIAWLKAYPGRFTHAHVRDKRVGADGLNESVALGAGTLDLGTFLSESKLHGVHTFIVEQEHYFGTTPLDAARANAAFMKQR